MASQHNYRKRLRYTSQIYRDFLRTLKHIKTVDIGSEVNFPYRIGLVNDKLWLRCNHDNSGVNVYSLELDKTGSIDLGRSDLNSAHQVGDNQVVVTSNNGLLLYDINGQFLSKIADGFYTDVNDCGTTVVAMDAKKYRVITFRRLNESDDEFDEDEVAWKQTQKMAFYDSAPEMKLVHTVGDLVYVCFSHLDKVLGYNKQGVCEVKYDDGIAEEDIDHFQCPCVAGSDRQNNILICDVLTHRILVLRYESLRSWEEYSLDGVEYPRDLIVVDDYVYILHGKRGGEEKLSKYEIQYGLCDDFLD